MLTLSASVDDSTVFGTLNIRDNQDSRTPAELFWGSRASILVVVYGKYMCGIGSMSCVLWRYFQSLVMITHRGVQCAALLRCAARLMLMSVLHAPVFASQSDSACRSFAWFSAVAQFLCLCLFFGGAPPGCAVLAVPVAAGAVVPAPLLGFGAARFFALRPDLATGLKNSVILFSPSRTAAAIVGFT